MATATPAPIHSALDPDTPPSVIRQLARADDDWVAYALTGGLATKLFRGSWSECVDYLRDKPRGPNGGSTHIAYRPRERDETALIPSKRLAAVRPALVRKREVGL